MSGNLWLTEQEFNVTIHEGLKRHPKTDLYWVQLLAVRDGEVVAWSVADNHDIALEILRDELF